MDSKTASLLSQVLPSELVDKIDGYVQKAYQQERLKNPPVYLYDIKRRRDDINRGIVRFPKYLLHYEYVEYQKYLPSDWYLIWNIDNRHLLLGIGGTDNSKLSKKRVKVIYNILASTCDCKFPQEEWRKLSYDRYVEAYTMARSIEDGNVGIMGMSMYIPNYMKGDLMTYMEWLNFMLEIHRHN